MINLRKKNDNKQNRNSMMVTGNTTSYMDGIIQIQLNSGCFLTKDIGSLNSKDTIKIYNYLCSLLVYSMKKLLSNTIVQNIIVIIDATKISVKCLRLVLKSCQNALAYKIKQAIIIHPEKFINQQKINIDILLENYNYKTILCNKNKLFKYINIMDLIDDKLLPNRTTTQIIDLKKDFEEFFKNNPSYITNTTNINNVNNNYPNLNKFLQKDKCLFIELDQPNYGRYSRLYEDNDPMLNRLNDNDDIDGIYEKIDNINLDKTDIKSDKEEINGEIKTKADLDLFIRERDTNCSQLDYSINKDSNSNDRSVKKSTTVETTPMIPDELPDGFLKLIDQQRDCINELLEWINNLGLKWLKSLNDVGESIDECRQLDKQHKELSIKTEQIVDQSSEIVEIIDFLYKESPSNSSTKLDLIGSIKSLSDILINSVHDFRKKVKNQTLIRTNSIRFHELLNEFYNESDKLLQTICIESKTTDSDSITTRQNELKILEEKITIVEEKYQLTYQICNNFDNLLHDDEIDTNNKDLDFIKESLKLATERRKRCYELLDLYKLKLQQIIQLDICEKDQEQVIQWIIELNSILLNNNFRKNINKFQLNNKLNHFEQSGISCREYGKQLSQVSLFLRRSLRFEISPQLTLQEQMNSAWGEFERNLSRHRSI